MNHAHNHSPSFDRDHQPPIDPRETDDTTLDAENENADDITGGRPGNLAKETLEPSWYFTFGIGSIFAGCYVKIAGTNQGSRDEMLQRFGKAWAFQYATSEAAGVERHGLVELSADLGFRDALRKAKAFDEISATLYPADDPMKPWNGETIEKVSDIVMTIYPNAQEEGVYHAS